MLTFASNSFQGMGLAQAGTPFFAMLTTGQQRGRAMLVTANTSNSLTLDITDKTTLSTPLNAASFSVATGDQVQVFPGDTLGSFFGSSAAGLSIVAGGSSSSADIVSIYNRSTAKFDQYFFNTTIGSPVWQRIGGGASSANGVVLYPEAAVSIFRKAGRPLTVGGVTGSVPTAPPLTKILGRVGFYTGTRFPVDVTLGQLTTISPWTPAPTLLAADVLSLYNTTTNRWENYFLNGATWQLSGSPSSQNAKVIPAGTAIGLLKRTTSAPPSYPYPQIPNLPYEL